MAFFVAIDSFMVRSTRIDVCIKPIEMFINECIYDDVTFRILHRLITKLVDSIHPIVIMSAKAVR